MCLILGRACFRVRLRVMAGVRARARNCARSTVRVMFGVGI